MRFPSGEKLGPEQGPTDHRGDGVPQVSCLP
jgi:hypothetical protein